MMRDIMRQPGPASVRNPFRDPGGTRGCGWPPMSEEQAARTVGDIVTASAAGRTVDVLAALLLALGEGSHQLSIVAERANGTTASLACPCPPKLRRCVWPMRRGVPVLSCAADVRRGVQRGASRRSGGHNRWQAPCPRPSPRREEIHRDARWTSR